MRLAPCRCGHPGVGCTCWEERRAEADRAEAVERCPYCKQTHNEAVFAEQGCPGMEGAQ